MKKIAVIYWSGSGNTEAMANEVLAGVKEKGAEASLLLPSEVDENKLSEYSALAFGCPAMGNEVLEEGEFEPMFQKCLPRLGGKHIALFGSYGWGDGEWMRNWDDSCDQAGANRVCDSVICTGFPDDAALAECRALGAALAEA